MFYSGISSPKVVKIGMKINEISALKVAVSQHHSLGKTTEEIAACLGLTTKRVKEWTMMLDKYPDQFMIQHIPTKPDISGLNHIYFDNIDTLDRAYWLGYLYADGNVKAGNSNVVSLAIGLPDEEQIDKLAATLGVIPYKRYYWYSTTNYSVQWQFASKQIKRALIAHGCVPAKSMIVRLPILESRELMLAFLLGVYDGDGTSGNSEITCGNQLFLEDIKNYFNIHYEISSNQHTPTLAVGIRLLDEALSLYSNSLSRKSAILRGRLVNAVNSWVASPCPNCSKPMYHMSAICRRCSLKHSERILWPTNEDLAKLIWQFPLMHLAKQLGVSDNAVKKRCIVRGILRPESKYWNKIHKIND